MEKQSVISDADFQGLKKKLDDPDIQKKIIKSLEERVQKQKGCKEKGHPGEKVSYISQYRGAGEANCYCDDCGDLYSRNLTSGEQKEWKQLLNKPMTF